MRINEVLARRTDLSTFLVHLTRSTGPETSAKDNLKSIIRAGRIEARSPFGMAYEKLEAADQRTDSQRCVCFTETPLEHVNLLAADIDNRRYRFEPYGIAITRRQGRLSSVNPVWYLDITPGHAWLTNHVEALVIAAIQAGRLDEQPILRLAPFIEQMGTSPGGLDTAPYRKEFWWEREWRHAGDFNLPNSYIVVCPADDWGEIRGVLKGMDQDFAPRVSFVDPSWSLETIIGRLAGFNAHELGLGD